VFLKALQKYIHVDACLRQLLICTFRVVCKNAALASDGGGAYV